MTKNTLNDVLPEPSLADRDRAAQVQAMFNKIAGRYDQLNDWISFGFHRGWKRKACQKLRLPHGGKALDVCTGTGDLIQYLLPLVGDKGSVNGLDFSQEMLAIAHQRYDNDPRVSLQQGDALILPYEDNTFDGAIISFGLRNVTDIPKALQEMYRVIKPGGWMVNLDTAPKPALPGMRFYFSNIMPIIGGLLSRETGAYRYLSNSTEHFLPPKALKAAFETAGCVEVSCETLMLGSVSLQAGRKPAE